MALGIGSAISGEGTTAPGTVGADSRAAGEPVLSATRPASGRRVGTVPELTTVLRSVPPHSFPRALAFPARQVVHSSRSQPTGPYRRIDPRSGTLAKVLDRMRLALIQTRPERTPGNDSGF